MNTIAPKTTRALTIAIIGTGSIGSAFAYHLARAGHEVTAVARPGSTRLQQLQRDHGLVDKNGAHVALTVVDQLNPEVPYDLVLVTTLAHQVDAVLPALQAGKARCVQFMFNTFAPERLQAALGADRVSFGMPFAMAHLDADGILTSTVSPARKTLHGDQRWVDLFNAAGIPSAFEPDMLLWLRCHTPMCIAMEAISFAAVRRGGGASWGEAMIVARGTRAGFAVLKGLGHRLHPPPKVMIDALPTPLIAMMLWCISRVAGFRDLLATGVNECRALVDAVVAAGQGVDPPMPTAVRAVAAMRPTP